MLNLNNDIIFISIGNLVTDKIYDEKLNLIKKEGGGCNWNVLYNLAKLGEQCYAIGTCGIDSEGDIAVDSLKRVNVDTTYITRKNKSTDVISIIIPAKKLGDNTVKHTVYDPFTGRKTISSQENLLKRIPDELSDKQIYLILDKFYKVNYDFMTGIKNKTLCVDIGNEIYIKYFKGEYILKFLRQAKIVLLNKNVSKILFKKLNIENEIELFNLLNLDLFILTNGKKGAKFLYNENGNIKIINKTPEIVRKIVDPSGAGDIFFANFIKEYAYKNYIDEEFIDNTFRLANAASREIIQQIGSRK